MIYQKLADMLKDFADCERRTLPSRMRQAQKHFPHEIIKCEICGKNDVVSHGACPDCFDVAAGACQWRANTVGKKK